MTAGEDEAEPTESTPDQLLLFSEDKERIARDDGALYGFDEMNFVELLLGLPLRRKPSVDRVVTSPWEEGERSYYIQYSHDWLRIDWEGKSRRPKENEIDFYMEVKAPDDPGLPKGHVEDIVVALLKLSAEQAFEDSKVETTRYQLMEVMNWPKSSYYYERLDETLKQLVQMSVDTNAVWDPCRQKYYEAAFNILDSTKMERDRGDKDTETFVRWGTEVFEMFGRGYMKLLDTEFYYSLDNSSTKRLYRWLDKHLRLRTRVEVDVLRLAQKVLGYGVSYQYPSQVIEKLEPKLETLYRMGFVRWEVEKAKSDSGKKYIFTKITPYTAVIYPRRDHVIEALSKRGVKQAARLTDELGWERCLRYVEYHDWKEQNGNAPDNSGAWLATAIKKEYDLPPKLQETIDRAKEETAQWCESMFEGLSEDQQEAVEAQAFDNMSDEQKQEYREGNAAAQHERLRQRNRILLSRREDLL
jgi:hypothetical protein